LRILVVVYCFIIPVYGLDTIKPFGFLHQESRLRVGLPIPLHQINNSLLFLFPFGQKGTTLGKKVSYRFFIKAPLRLLQKVLVKANAFRLDV